MGEPDAAPAGRRRRRTGTHPEVGDTVAAGGRPDEGATNGAVPGLVRRRLDGSHPRGGLAGGGRGVARRRARGQASRVWIFGGGVERQRASIVATDGTVVDGPVPETKAVVGGFSILEVSSREEALAWAAKIAESCRCSQEVREIMDDPES